MKNRFLLLLFISSILLTGFNSCSMDDDCKEAEQIWNQFAVKIANARGDIIQIEALRYQRDLTLKKLDCPEVLNLID